MYFKVWEQRDSLVSYHEKARLEKEQEQRRSEEEDITTQSSTQVLEGLLLIRMCSMSITILIVCSQAIEASTQSTYQ